MAVWLGPLYTAPCPVHKSAIWSWKNSKDLELGWQIAAMLVFQRAEKEPKVLVDRQLAGLTGCRFASVSTTDRTFLCSNMTWFVPFWLCQFCKPDTRGCKLRRARLSGTPFVWTGQASKAFHLFKAPRAESIFEEFLFSKFFFFFLPLPTFCLRENEMSIFCFLIFFQESKGLLTSSLSPPFLPSSRRYSSEKKRTKYCSCSLS